MGVARAAALLALAAALCLPAHGAEGASPAGVDCKLATALPDGPPLPRLMTRGHRVGLALGGGSLHGMAHVGILNELEPTGLDVRVVSGTSVGAVVGALWASGLDARAIEAFMRANGWSDVGRFARSRQGVFSNQPMIEPLTTAFRGRRIESWPRRFGAVATNLADGQRRILATGDGATAVQASSAVPVLFTPVQRGGESLADGGLVEPVPVSAARAMGADFVIAVDVSYRPYEEEASGLTGIALQSMHILINALGTAQLKEADVAIRLDLHQALMKCGPDALIAAGRRGLRAAWPEITRKLASAPHRGKAR